MYTKFSELSNDEIIQIINKFNTFRQILKNLNCIDNTYNRKLLIEFIKLNKIDTSHIKIRIARKGYEENPKYCKFCGKLIPYEKEIMNFVIIHVLHLIIIKMFVEMETNNLNIHIV